MDEKDEDVNITEEPLLRYWNPCRRNTNCNGVFSNNSMTSVQNISTSLNYINKINTNNNFYETKHYSNLRQSPSSCGDISSASFIQELPVKNEYHSINDTFETNLPQNNFETTSNIGCNRIMTLDSLAPQSPLYLTSPQNEDIKPIIKQEIDDDIHCRYNHELRDIITFNSIDEALDSIDPPLTPDSNWTTASVNSIQGCTNNLMITNEKHEEVVKAAKSLFSKRTRTLYHWLFPDTSKNKLKATVSAAWDTLSEGEKHFYISQILGRFGLQASSLMVNPQLGGMKCLPNDIDNKINRKKNDLIEDQRAVNSLFDSCEDADNWASYSEPKQAQVKTKSNVKVKPERKNKRKKQKIKKEPSNESSDQEEPIETEIKKVRKYKKARKEGSKDFEEDPELAKELEKFRLITEAAEEDIWGDLPDPDELFAEIDFLK